MSDLELGIYPKEFRNFKNFFSPSLLASLKRCTLISRIMGKVKGSLFVCIGIIDAAVIP